MPLLIKETAAYFSSQLFTNLPVPTKSFAGKTIIVTGGNAGLGFEATRHLVRLGATRVIIAVRNLEKGTAAAKTIHDSTGRSNVVEVWELDLASYASVIAFSERAQKELDRLDILLENAGISTHTFQKIEDNESITIVNFVNTMLLGLLLLPKLRETASLHGQEVMLTFVGSFLYRLGKFPQKDSEDILSELADESKADMDDRYSTLKLMLLQTVRELASKATRPENEGRITISYINPGSVKTNMGRNNGILFNLLRMTIFRATEVGSRTLIHGAEGGSETHGKYLSDCKIGK